MITFQLALSMRCDAANCVGRRWQAILELRGLFEEDIAAICCLVAINDGVGGSAVFSRTPQDIFNHLEN